MNEDTAKFGPPPTRVRRIRLPLLGKMLVLLLCATLAPLILVGAVSEAWGTIPRDSL